MGAIKDIIKLAEEELANKRSKLKGNLMNDTMTNIIRTNTKLQTAILLQYSMETTLTQSAVIWTDVNQRNLTFNEACNNAGI